MEGNQNYGFDTFDASDDLLELGDNKPAEVKTPTLESEGEDILGITAPAKSEKTETKAESVSVDDITEGDTDVGENTEQSITGDDTFQKLSENLLQMGVFSLNEGEEKLDINNPEAFQERWQQENQRAASSYLNQIVGQYGEEYAEAFDIIFQKGLNPFEYFTRQAEITSYEEMNLEDEAVQKQVIRSFYNKQGITPERIEKKIQTLSDLGSEDLAEEARDAHAILVKEEKKGLEQRAAQVAQERQQREQQIEAYQQSAASFLQSKLKEKEFDGIPVNQKVAQDTLNYMFVKKYQLPTGETWSEYDRFVHELQNPQNIELAMKVALMAQDGFKTTKIAKNAVSKQSDKLFNNLTTKNTQNSRSQPTKGWQDPFEF